MTKTTERAAWIGGIALAAIGVGTAVYFATKPAAAATTPQGGGGGGGGGTTLTTSTLQPGHVYRLTFGAQLTPADIAAMSSTVSVQQGFDALFGPGLFTVQNANATASGATVVFRYNGQVPLPVSAKSFNVPSATITDLGLPPGQ